MTRWTFKCFYYAQFGWKEVSLVHSVYIIHDLNVHQGMFELYRINTNLCVFSDAL